MKIRLLWLALALCSAVQATALDSGKQAQELKPQQEQAKVAHLASALLGHYHYRSAPLDDALSEKIFDLYLKALDSEKFFFLQSDVDAWKDARTKLDDAINSEDLSVPFTIFNRYSQRVVERFTYARSLLKAGFDFQTNETYQYSRSKAPWPKTEDEVKELWRKRVKNDWLQLKLAGKDAKAIAETLDKRYDSAIKRVGRLNSEDAFQLFMNAYTMAVEPHTNYLGRKASENFDISMKLSLVGIGAVLEEKDEYATIKELVPGGPAALSGKLKVGDRIAGVGQGENGAISDVVGWRLDDTVGLIRGNADSVVVLDVLPAEAGLDGQHKRVTLVRKKISLEEQAAKKSVFTVKEGKETRRIGVISLPTFYEDFGARQKGDQDFRSATRDVERLMGELKKEKVDGLLMDLRNNGGGSLREAIELTGLFIDTGPVVQQRDAKGRVIVEGDTKAGTAWDGPLAVLINRGSASASEIFAAAIQDYGRGIVIGDQSFGKGTVQAVLNLDQMTKNDKQNFGDLKLTIAQFFRINGGTTQVKGVSPDISLPTIADGETFGESAHENALPWMQIKPAPYEKVGEPARLLPTLAARHEARIKSDAEFRQLQKDIEEFKERRKRTAISLNEDERRKEREALQAKLAARKKSSALMGAVHQEGKPPVPAKSEAPQEDELDQIDDPEIEKSAKNGKNTKDILLFEAVNILGDAVGLVQTDGRLTAGLKAAATGKEDRKPMLEGASGMQ